MSALLVLPLSGAAGVGATPLLAQSARRVTAVADGVYAIEHEDAQNGFASGNTTVILGERQVFVVDSCFLPSDARDDVAERERASP